LIEMQMHMHMHMQVSSKRVESVSHKKRSVGKLHRRMRKHTAFSLCVSILMVCTVPVLTYLQPAFAETPSLSVAAPTASNYVHLVVTPYEEDGLSRRPSCEHTRTHLQFTNTVRFVLYIIHL
jgi:hypothetical protein